MNIPLKIKFNSPDEFITELQEAQTPNILDRVIRLTDCYKSGGSPYTSCSVYAAFVIIDCRLPFPILVELERNLGTFVSEPTEKQSKLANEVYEKIKAAAEKQGLTIRAGRYEFPAT